VHGVINDNSNPYRNMVIDAMRMNQGYIGNCSIIDEEPNVDMIKFFLSFERLWRTIIRWVYKSQSIIGSCIGVHH
jgi:hypothetical protein